MRNLEFAASQQAHNIREARRDVNNSLHSAARLKSVVNYWKPRLSKAAESIVKRANNHGFKINRYKPDTPEYYNTLINLIRARAK